MNLCDFNFSMAKSSSRLSISSSDCLLDVCEEHTKAYGRCGVGYGCSDGGGTCGCGYRCTGGGGQCGSGYNCSGS